MRAALMISVATLGLTAGVPVYAQEAQPGAAGEPQASADQGIADIVVTAQRREENLQKAAVAVDAVGGGELANRGIATAADISKAVPSLSVPAASGTTAVSIFLRGVGNVTSSSFNDPAVTPTYDGVVLGRAGGVFGASFYDLARVEVLKGPQGILYGRNATGGAINIIPARPELGHNGGGFNVQVGNYDTVMADGYINLATSDNSALRVAAMRQIHDGYNRDGTDDLRRGGLRAQFLIEPSDRLTVRVGADYTRLTGKGPGGSYVGAFTAGADGYSFTPAPFDRSEGLGTAAANAYRQTMLGGPAFGFLSSMNTDQKLDATLWGVNAEINWKTDIGTFTIIPAYRKSEDLSLWYGPGFNTAHTNEHTQQKSLEVRLAGDAGMFDYVVGGFYFSEKIRANNEYNQEFVLPIQNYQHKTDSLAAFGQLTANLSDRLRLVGGLRYTRDKKHIDGIINNFITFCGGMAPDNIVPPASFANGCAAPGALPYYPNFLNVADTMAWLTSNGWIAANSQIQPNPQVFPLLNGVGTIFKTHSPLVDDRTDSRVTWKASVEFDVTPRNLLYAKVETGYRAGGLQLTEGRTRYNPEYITAYSIGSKNRFFDNRVQLNLEAFWWKYKDQQITYFTVDNSGTLISSNENAGRATIKGIDADLIVKPARSTTLTAKVQYLDAKYDDLHLYTAAPRDNIGCSFTYTGGSAGGAPVKDFNCSGNQLLYSPKWTVNLGAEQVVGLNDHLELVGSVDTAWRDAQWGGFEYLAFQRIPAYWTTDLNLTLRGVDAKWSLGAYVANLENKRRYAQPQSSPIGFAIGLYTPPRTYGLRLSANF